MDGSNLANLKHNNCYLNAYHSHQSNVTHSAWTATVYPQSLFKRVKGKKYHHFCHLYIWTPMTKIIAKDKIKINAINQIKDNSKLIQSKRIYNHLYKKSTLTMFKRQKQLNIKINKTIFIMDFKNKWEYLHKN